MPTLTPKQATFAAEYLKDKNATQAAIRSGYSKKTAETQGSRLFRKAHVRAVIDAAIEKAAQAAGLTLEQHLKDLKKLRDDAADAGDYGPAVTAETSRGKVSGLYVEKHQHSVDSSFAEMLKEARARAAKRD